MISWAGQVSPGLLYATAVFDVLGGLGVLRPSVLRVLPRVTLAAAVGCILLQASAIVFHFWRDEAANTSFSFSLIALWLFVFWGRRSRFRYPPPS
jgi:multisubunit Na+/H+ antiporter MnhG subunit